MAELFFRDSEEARTLLTNQALREVRNMYLQLVIETQQQINSFPQNNNQLGKTYLQNLQKQLLTESTNITEAIGESVTDKVKSMVDTVVDEMNGINTNAGFRIQMSRVKTEIVQKVMSGGLYEANWNFSSAIWGINEKMHSDINSIVAKGIAANKSSYEIAKDLESYVNPDVRKDWSWSRVYPGTNKVVDYSAQRLARTMVSHAYQAAFVESTFYNPFVTAYRWRSALIDGRTCDICIDRDGQLFEKNELPLDHPNGLCTFTAEIEELSKIADDIARWYNSPSGTYKEIDEYAEWLRRN